MDDEVYLPPLAYLQTCDHKDQLSRGVDSISKALVELYFRVSYLIPVRYQSITTYGQTHVLHPNIKTYRMYTNEA